MNFKRGFKAYANRIALEIREELGLVEAAAVCPWVLAEHLCISVTSLDEIARGSPTVASAVEYLSKVNPNIFSAVTLFDGHERRIIHNHGHALTRQRANLAHELAHALLRHEPHSPFCVSGQRPFDSNLEAEAGWLGPVLLIPNEAAIWAVSLGMGVSEVASHFGVSWELAQFRVRMSGARKIVAY